MGILFPSFEFKNTSALKFDFGGILNEIPLNHYVPSNTIATSC